ncbi:hypothetical protein F511_22987 [Dorcoceras hygrometricum]|uniref:Uncharacterized protein n=1 Tax=Dorcoceras hygrometricum TaxID=472368 RepID=A0A2Z7ADZ3_9LAMI|nr:hypothetical protein F511_22987 [Dorcoceras hygrometricum]
MVDRSQRKAKGFAAQIGVLLKGMPTISMGDGVPFPSAKILSMRTVDTYIVTNTTIDARAESEEPGMAKTAVEKKTPKARRGARGRASPQFPKGSDDESVGPKEIVKDADTAAVMNTDEADVIIAKVLEETLELGVSATEREGQGVDEALFEEDFARWLILLRGTVSPSLLTQELIHKLRAALVLWLARRHQPLLTTDISSSSQRNQQQPSDVAFSKEHQNDAASTNQNDTASLQQLTTDSLQNNQQLVVLNNSKRRCTRHVISFQQLVTKRYTQNAAFQLIKTTSRCSHDWFLKPAAGHSAGTIPHNATADSATTDFLILALRLVLRNDSVLLLRHQQLITDFINSRNY